MGLRPAKTARLNACLLRNATLANCRLFSTGIRVMEEDKGSAIAKGQSTSAIPGKTQSVGEDRVGLELYLSVLSSTSTKREARSYLQRFTPSLTTDTLPRPPAILKYLKQSSFTQSDIKARNQTYVQRLVQNHQPLALTNLSPTTTFFIPEIAEEEIHIGLVKIRGVSTIDNQTLNGIGRTLSQLCRLGLFPIVIVDEAPPPNHSPTTITAWRHFLHQQSDRVVSAIENKRGRARRVDGCITVTQETPTPEITIPNVLISPLSRGVIPVLAPIAFNSSQRAVATTADEVVLSLVALLSSHSPDSTPVAQPISLDRLIFLDPLGGIPSYDRPAGAHVFINLEQEYQALYTQLSSQVTIPRPHPSPYHLSNLTTLRSALRLLPPTSSALITTPELAAAYVSAPKGNEKPKNPLIHNLLTDKPVISSSLPVLPSSTGTLTTLLKHGIPVTVHSSLHSMDLPKLVALIEDSFGKTLDVDHYLERVQDQIAVVVVAGDYEGAAIVTWEYPREDGEGRVCYLDKFAVLKRSQGTGGVADVVWRAMLTGVREGVKRGVEGVVWRSREANPVNKWYFERAKGTWKIPGSGWTMFWTTRDEEVCKRRFMDYARVCGGIEPSLRDE